MFFLRKQCAVYDRTSDNSYLIGNKKSRTIISRGLSDRRQAGHSQYCLMFLLSSLLLHCNFLLVSASLADNLFMSSERVIWAHAINSQHLLDQILKAESNVTMIEADVQLGHLVNNDSEDLIPIMAHPPNRTSDLSLHRFIEQIIDFDFRNPKSKKGFKLDFKSSEAIKASASVLDFFVDQLDSIAVWLNADVLKGPINATNEPEPVNAEVLFSLSSKYPKFPLSLGWTTNFIDGRNGHYTKENVDEMIALVRRFQPQTNGHNITFALRTIYAGLSLNNVQLLLSEFPAATITLWTALSTDLLSCSLTKSFVEKIGREKFYFDLPDSFIRCLFN